MSGLEDSRFRERVRANDRSHFSVLKIVAELFSHQRRILIERACLSEGYPTIFAAVKLNGKYLVHHEKD